MRVLVCGGRDYKDRIKVYNTLDDMHCDKEIGLIIHGGATGADEWARLWAQAQDVMSVSVPAKWRDHGRRAGPIRNQQMLKLDPDVVVAFPGGKGTANMIDQAQRAGVEVLNIEED